MERVHRIFRNPRWYAETIFARARQRIARRSTIDTADAFVFAETLFTASVMQPSPLVELDRMEDQAPRAQLPRSLRRLLDQAGSDKGSRHGYADVYQQWALTRQLPVEIVVEIGLGSPSALTPSNMGPEAKPGASAVAFSEYFSGSWVIGADIDPRAFPAGVDGDFLVADQLRPPSFGAMVKKLSETHGFDFGVVDGLHTPEADINSMLILLPWLRPLGLLSIEDIGKDPHLIRAWQRLIDMLPYPYSGRLHECHLSHLVIVTRV